MKMKKGIALMLTAMLLAVLTACGTNHVAFARGEWNKSHYENRFMELAFDMPEGWEALSDEEIADRMDIPAAQVSDGRFNGEYLNAQNIYDVMASDAENETGTSVIIMMENLALSVDGTGCDEEDYAAAVAENLLAQDADYEVIGSKAVSFAGKEYYSMETSSYEGKLHQIYLFCKEDKYMTSVIITYLPDLTAPDSIFALFSAAK